MPLENSNSFLRSNQQANNFTRTPPSNNFEARPDIEGNILLLQFMASMASRFNDQRNIGRDEYGKVKGRNRTKSARETGPQLKSDIRRRMSGIQSS